MVTIFDDTADSTSALNEKPRPTVLFYSPDLDFCISMRLLFQDRYHVVTVSDPELVLVTAREFYPSLVIVDSPPTKMMLQRFEIIKRENLRVHIMSFYAPQFHTDNGARNTFRNVDAAFPKPIDLVEVTKSMSEMLAESG